MRLYESYQKKGGEYDYEDSCPNRRIKTLEEVTSICY